MKKQIKRNAKPNQAYEKNSASGIQSFFKSTPKDFVVTEKVAEVKCNDGAKAFYADIIKEKLRNVQDKEYMAQDENGNNEVGYQADGAYSVVVQKEDCNRVHSTKAQIVDHDSKTKCAGCVQKSIERDEWEQKYKTVVENRKALKKVYVNQAIRFSELDSKYKDLLKTATRTYHQSVDEAATSIDIFTPTEVKFLQSMQLDKKQDCTFILNCLKYAYKLDLSVLTSRTLTGTLEWTEITKKGVQVHHDAKAKVTPKKAERIKGLFIERISKCEIDSADYHSRMREPYVNTLIAAGIRNISKKFK